MKNLFLSLIVGLNIFNLFADDKIDALLKESSKRFEVESEKSKLNISTFKINRASNAEIEDKDETYFLFYKKYPDSKKIVFQSEENESLKIRFTYLTDGTIKKERFVKNKGYELITTAGDSNNLWGIDLKDLEFAEYNSTNFKFETLNEKDTCKTLNGGEGTTIKGTPLVAKNYQYVTLTLSNAKKFICEIKFFKSGAQTAYKNLSVPSTREKDGFIRPKKIILLEEKSAAESQKSVLEYLEFEANKVSDEVFN